MYPPSRRPSVLGPPEVAFQAANSPHTVGGMHPAGLPSASPAPMGGPSPVPEWQEATPQQQMVPPLQQQQRPVVMPSSLDQQNAYMNESLQQQPRQNLQQFSNPPQAQARPMQQMVPGMSPTKASVFAAPAEGHTSFMNANGSGGGMHQQLNGMTRENAGMITPVGPQTPFGDLEYDFNVLLSNSTQLNREEAAALARQLGNVGGT